MKRLFLALLAIAFATGAARAAIDTAPKVHARLIAEHETVAPGSTVTVALEEVIRPGWHTYWRNPGDAGQPTEIRWTLPAGWQAGAIQWPYPKREPVGPLMDYGYEGTLWLLSDIRVPADAKPGDRVLLKADADWLVCRQICIPEQATLTLPLRIAAAAAPAPPALAARFASWRARRPVMSPWPMRFAKGKDLRLYIQAPALAAAHPKDAAFFPFAPGTVADAAPQRLGFAKDGVVVALSPAGKTPARLKGLLVLTSADGSVQALEADAPPGPVPPADFPMAAPSLGLALALLFAFLGGLILNIMPCVLPILAMKALAIASHAGAERAHARAEAFAYSAGAILSFVAFGLAIAVLRAGGAAIGWGFQLQEPVVVAGFALLIFAVGLNLSGLYEIAPVSAGSGLAGRGGFAGAFFTGVLAVAVAAPCTAPFMAAALGYALTEPVPVVLGVFVALGLGFALPFLLLGLWPALQRILPRPGAWMLRLKQFLAFPMYGAAVWLVWVLAQEAGAGGVAIVLAAMVVLALSLWLWSATRLLSPRGRGIGALAALIVFLAALAPLTLLGGASAPAATASGGIASEPYSSARLEQLRAGHRAVFVDATAAWCITCLVNEKTALSRPAVRAAFAQHHVAYLVADWTNRNSAITALLEAHGRDGVPLYLYYAPDAANPAVLPQILTEGEVLKALRG